MRVRFVGPVIVILMVLSGCTPTLTGEQLVEYERYVAARATDAAAELAIAEARATQAAALQIIAQATAGALAATPAVTVTVAATPTVAAPAATIGISPTITATAVITGTRILIPVIPGSVLAPTVTVTATATATRSPMPAPTFSPSPTATRSPTPSPTPTALPTATAVLTPSAPPPTTTLVLTVTPPVAAPITVTVGVTLEVRAASGNLRGGPGVEFDILGTTSQGRRYGVMGRNAEGTWWQICCVNDKPAWIADSLATIGGDRNRVPIRSPLMPDRLAATWALHWLCYGEGCPQTECVGQSRAQALQVRNVRWLEVKRQTTWENKCGKDEDWLVQIDRYSGQETQAVSEPPLFYIWMGADPGPENRAIEHLGRTLSLWCTGTRTREVPQSGGWTALFEGQACYDRASGMLVTMEYVKRWLFTGTIEGRKYERQYFGDYEVYQQILVDTNVPLSAK
ncbi:MAG: hypothetical protein ACP5UQ_13265 [Anaerolineae bacterium]